MDGVCAFIITLSVMAIAIMMSVYVFEIMQELRKISHMLKVIIEKD
jgi:hypothetical protein